MRIATGPRRPRSDQPRHGGPLRGGLRLDGAGAREPRAATRRPAVRARQCVALGDKVLEHRPGYRLALHAQQITLGVLSQLAQDSAGSGGGAAGRAGARSRSRRRCSTSIPTASSAQQSRGRASSSRQILWSQGRLRECAIPPYQDRQNEFGRAARGGSRSSIAARDHAPRVGVASGRCIGDDAAAAADARRPAQVAGAAAAQREPASPRGTGRWSRSSSSGRGHARARAREITRARAASQRRRSRDCRRCPAARRKRSCNSSATLCMSSRAGPSIGLGDYAAAERSTQGAMEARRVIVGEATDDQRWIAGRDAATSAGRGASRARRPTPCARSRR